MARAYYVNQESLVKVKAGAHVTSPAAMSGGGVVVLGVAETGIEVTPGYDYHEVLTDRGGTKPCEIMTTMYDVRVKMNLIHFDLDILRVCEDQALGKASLTAADGKAGYLLGNNLSLYASGNYFMGMSIVGSPWTLPAAFLDQRPYMFPLSTERSRVELNWRGIAYVTIGGDGTETTQNFVWDYNALT